MPAQSNGGSHPATRRAKRPTLRDVAALAGVSIATASKALNGRGAVHPDTRDRVLVAAEEVAFTPNRLARNLLSGRSGTIGLLTNDLIGRFSIPILMGAEDASGTGEMSVLLCDARGDAIREAHQLKTLLSRRVDGLIVVGSDTDPRPSVGEKIPVPVVYAYAPSTSPEDCSLVPDNIGGGRQVTQHLLDIGRTRIAHITGPADFLAAADRAQGVAEALGAAGLPLVGDRPLYGAWTEAWGRTAADTILDRFPDTDAIVCGSDQVARGVLDALHERDLDIPGDVAVTGFDNWDVFATGSRPRLTTVDMDLELLGRLAAERLIRAIDQPLDAGITTLPCRVVVRESTAG
ncbi:MAG TPA: LacI family DNA-binding transcriptional regulator [Microbacteriaceae bacterium]|nr:LacI family DNA-binding transcriptional regulator [Microbacteriaceae bacterium]